MTATINNNIKTLSAIIPTSGGAGVNARKYFNHEILKELSLVVVTASGWPKELAYLEIRRARRGNGVSPVYAHFWLFHDNCPAGSGKAAGYGYCKISAAVAEAIQKSGIQLSLDIAGRGEGAVCEALGAIAKACGYDKYIVGCIYRQQLQR